MDGCWGKNEARKKMKEGTGYAIGTRYHGSLPFVFDFWYEAFFNNGFSILQSWGCFSDCTGRDERSWDGLTALSCGLTPK
jgi:hypothetical protein